MEIDSKYRAILLESLEDLMYKISLELEEFKGQPLSSERKDLTKKQKLIEELQHRISMGEE